MNARGSDGVGEVKDVRTGSSIGTSLVGCRHARSDERLGSRRMSVAERSGSAMYELAAASWLRAHGYPDAHVTRSGIDVRANGVVVQVKAWSRPVGRPELHHLESAAASGERIFFFSRSGFTAAAYDYAHRADNDIELLVLSQPRTDRSPSRGWLPRTLTPVLFRARRVFEHRRVWGVAIVIAFAVILVWESSNWIVNAGR